MTKTVVGTFFFPVFLLLANDFLGVLKAQGGLDWVAMTKMGPNDMSGVVWALGMFFIFFMSFTY